MTPLRLRMIGDMRLAGLSAWTQANYSGSSGQSSGTRAGGLVQGCSTSADWNHSSRRLACSWCLVGTSDFRFRGMTFDGAADVVSIDRQMSGGYSAQIARFRQLVMASRLGIAVPSGPRTPARSGCVLPSPNRRSAQWRSSWTLAARGGSPRFGPVQPILPSCRRQTTSQIRTAQRGRISRPSSPLR
jgi:hypothetical protein